MSYIDAILLGVLQGLTEFLPVSSSGHLVLAQELLGINQPGLLFELLAHVGTLLAVLVYFRVTIFRLIASLWTKDDHESRRMIGWLVLGTIPAGLAGYFLESWFEKAFSSPVLTSAMLIVTGLILLSTRLVRTGDQSVGWRTALIIGVGQAMAIIPGISRSGSTIAFGLASKIAPARAAEFSFLLAIPVIAGAVILKSGEFAGLDPQLIGPYLLGSALSFVFGLLAVYLVLSAIRRGRFEYFAYYCFAAGILGLYLFV